MKQHSFPFIAACLIVLTIFSACKKQDTSNIPAVPNPSADSVQALDSALLVARDIYLWYNQIPSSFNARSYADPNEVMVAIRDYSNEPGFTQAVDRWSFAMTQEDWDNESNGIVMTNSNMNVSGDFGMTVFFRSEGDLRVRLAERASPAGVAGIRRGWRITKINGSSNITTANSTFIINNVYNSASTSFTFMKPDGSTVNLTLNAGTYKTQPVYLDTIYNYPGKKVGYLVFNSFLGDTAEMYDGFVRVFSNFADNQVTDVVIDLRYNGGGYVSVQETLADFLVSASANNGLMFKEQFNDKNTQYNSATAFHKVGTLNLDHIYFIVTSSTASASELLINNLKPYMDVQLVGPSSTYGKPVGFFPIPVGKWYVFPVSFRSTNKNGVGEYFNGLTVNKQVADGLDKDWGDVTESCLSSVIKRITTGSYARSAAVFTPLSDEVKKGNAKLDEPLFKGAIRNMIKIK